MKFSIIIPVYNASRYLRECLDSIARQKHTAWEAICVDDGSPDDSGSILDEYAAKDDRFKVIHQKNAGADAARNAALGIATGDWIAFVDSDDAINENWLRVAHDIIAKEQPDFLRFDATPGWDLTEAFLVNPADEGYEVFNGKDAHRWMWGILTMKGFMCFCFVPRRIINGRRFLPNIGCKEDSIWLLQMTPDVSKAIQGRQNGYFYRRAPNSLTKRNRRVSQTISYIEAYIGLFSSQKELAGRESFLEVMRKSVRTCIEYDVVDWVMKGRDVARQTSLSVRDKYMALAGEGAFSPKPNLHRRYRPGMWLWRKCGATWLISIPGRFFVHLRRLINVLTHQR